MAKVRITIEKLTPFGGIYSIMEKFDSIFIIVTVKKTGHNSKRYDSDTKYPYVSTQLLMMVAERQQDEIGSCKPDAKKVRRHALLTSGRDNVTTLYIVIP